MELLATGTGLAMFLAGHWIGVHPVVEAVLAVALLGLVAALAGWAGMRTRLRSPGAIIRSLEWGWQCFCVAVGGFGAWLVIGVTLLAKERLGDKPSPFDDVASGAVVALITAVVASRQSLYASYDPGSLARRLIQGRFRAPVGAMPTGVSNNDPHVLAVRAVNEETFASPRGGVSGWGVAPGTQRLELIRRFLFAPHGVP